jgi:hypothetical protein
MSELRNATSYAMTRLTTDCTHARHQRQSTRALAFRYASMFTTHQCVEVWGAVVQNRDIAHCDGAHVARAVLGK